MSEASAAGAEGSRSPSGSLRFIHFPPGFVANDWTRDLSLALRTYCDAVAVPFARSADGTVLGALYDSDGGLVADSQRAKIERSRERNQVVLPAGSKEDAKRMTGRSFFGHMNTVFGHMLLEVIARFWPDVDYDDFDHIVFFASPKRARSPRSVLTPTVLELLRALRVPVDKIRLVRGQPSILDEVALPSPPVVIKSCVDPRTVEAFDRIARAFDEEPDRSADALPARIYLSRSRLPEGNRRAPNESAIEALAESRGFTIVHPQELPIRRQVALVHHAEIIAGCDGSALHLADFARPGTRLLALDTRIAINQFMIDQARGLDALHVLALEQVLGNYPDWWTADLDRVGSALDLVVAP